MRKRPFQASAETGILTHQTPTLRLTIDLRRHRHGAWQGQEEARGRVGGRERQREDRVGRRADGEQPLTQQRPLDGAHGHGEGGGGGGGVGEDARRGAGDHPEDKEAPATVRGQI